MSQEEESDNIDTEMSLSQESNTSFDMETLSQDSSDELTDVECGSISSVILVNFMCHKYFKIDFGPRINFIIGKNGSGKSAILTAIVLVLGGRASNTSRGQCIKSFIKTGQERAKVTIKLCNYNGYNTASSFKHDIFGNTIVIERTFSISGTSSYSIRSASGKVISTKRDDLNHIIKHFNIQIDNPVCVLNQEISRNFLNSKNPKDKYAFFMKATQLEQIRNDYVQAQEKSKLTAIELKKRKAQLSDVEEEIKKIEHKIGLFNKSCDQGKKLRSLADEMIWALVNEKREELEKIKAKRIRKENDYDNLENKIIKIKESLNNFSKDKQIFSQRLETIVTELEQIKNDREVVGNQIKDLKSKRQSIHIQFSRYKNEYQTVLRDAKYLENKINELKQQYGDQVTKENEKRSRLEKIDLLSKEEKEKNAFLKMTQLQRQQLQTTVSKYYEQISEKQDEINDLTQTLESRKNELKNLKQSQNNQLQRFGLYLPELMRLIDVEFSKSHFIKKPIGPIGAKIKLKDTTAALAIETCLKGLVFAFCCDNHQDAKLLLSLINEVIGKARPPSIIIRKFKSIHDVSRYKIKSSKYKSMLDLLKIDDDPVANVLIDRLGIESIVYIPDEDEAREVMTNPQTVPINCVQAYTREGTNMYPRKEGQYFKQYGCNIKQARFLSRSVVDCIKELEEDVISISESIKTKKDLMEPIKKSLMESREDLLQAETRIKTLQREISKISEDLIDLRNVEEATPIEISELEAEFKGYYEKKSKLSGDLEKLKKEGNELNDNICNLEIELTNKERDKQEKMNARAPLEKEISLLDKKQTNEKSQLIKDELTLNELKEAVENLKKTEAELEKIFNSMKVKAEASCSEIKETRSSETINKEILEIQNFLAEQQKQIGEREAIVKKYEDKSRKFKETEEQIKNIEEYMKEFKHSMKMRFNEYNRLKDTISSQARCIFSVALEALNFSGSLEIYHEEEVVDGDTKKAKTLEIKVNPKISTQIETYNDTRSLSGGERSFSTVAFLIALWEFCNSPFRILDEVDVFMDVVTRSTAIQILIANAKLKSGKQYIFLSPLGLATDEESIRVHKMPDPIRVDPASEVDMQNSQAKK